MKSLFKTATLLLTLLGALSLSACSDKGPAEKVGEKIDNTITDIGNSIEDSCEKVKEKLDTSEKNC